MALGTAAGDMEAFSECHVILVAVPDSALLPVVEQLAAVKSRLPKTVVLQTSRIHDSNDLQRLRRRGAAVGSLQPLYALRRPVPSLAGVYCAVEGDASATRMARKMIRSWDGEFHLVRADQKIHLGVASSMAADFLPGLLEMIVRQLSLAGFLKKRSLRAVSHILDSAFQEYARSGRRTRSGPLLRNETATVQRYIERLEELDPAMAEAYRTTARQTIEALRRMNDDFAFLDHPTPAGGRAMRAAAGGSSK